MMKSKLNTIFLTSLIFLFSLAAQAASVSLTPTADGDVQTFGGNNVDTTDTVISFVQSGGLERQAILEFDLSSINDLATITSVSLDLTLTRFVSNTGSNPAAIDIFAYNGDGIVDISDFSAVATQVNDLSETTPAGGSGGDVRSFSFTDIATVQAALSGDLLTLRIQTDSFASINFAALENTSYDAATLNIEYSAVPLPAAWVLMVSAISAFAGMTRRK